MLMPINFITKNMPLIVISLQEDFVINSTQARIQKW